MLKNTFKVLFFLLLFALAFHLSTGKVYACATAEDCNVPGPEGCLAQSYYCDAQGACHWTWNCGCSGGWGAWGPCVDGYMTRYCTSNGDLYQISQCTSGTCPDCGTYPNCVEPDCSASCTYGCSSVSCDGGTCIIPTPTPVPPTPTPVPPTPTPNCINMNYCRTSNYSCTTTSSTYDPNTTIQCGGTNTCAQNLALYVPGTTGICYTTSGTCYNACRSKMYYCRTSDYTCRQTSSYYSGSGHIENPGSNSCETNLSIVLPGQTTGTCYYNSTDCQSICTPPPTVTPTTTPTGALRACNASCQANSQCSTGYCTTGGVCRNPSCPNDTDCVCSATPTPTPTPTPSICPVPPAPSGLSCNNGSPITWNAVSGADHYPFRLDANYLSWTTTGNCQTVALNDICQDLWGTERWYTFAVGTTYHVWVHTVNYCGNWSSGYTEIFCSGATPTPTPTPTGTLKACNDSCKASSQCSTGYCATNGKCRDLSCPNDTDCICVGTPTPTSTSTPTPIPTPTASPTPTSAGAWWQVVDSDVQTNGDLNSSVPTGLYFGFPGLGGFPGVAKYGDSTNLSSAKASAKGWLANSRYAPANGRVQDYAYFRRLIPEDVTLNPVSSFPSGGTASDGYYWYEYDGSVTGLPFRITSSVNLPAGRKVVLLVTGADLNIEKSINYTSGESIFVALVDGNINIDPSVGGAAFDLQGFFLADSNISTGVSSTPLHVKGSVAALGGLNLQRDLGASLNPIYASEVFEYDPASAFLFPPKLSIEKTRWKEVAP